jgi:Coenzyme PQQ synthesis protein D (PqqD)
MSDRGLGVNSPQVIHESIDGEVIIIDLGTGTYYSAKGSAAEVWEAIDRFPGVSEESVAAAVATAYELPAEAVAGDVHAFVFELLSEGIVVLADAHAGDGATASIDRDGTSSGPFAAPKLEKYTDMQDLVLIDPVHEVDATGWPERRPEAVTHGAND